MKAVMYSIATVLVLAVAAHGWAGGGPGCGQPAGDTAKAGCCAKDAAVKAACHKEGTLTAGGTCTADKSACAGKTGCTAALAADMPKMHYLVGDKTTCCPKQAEELAGGDAAKIRYVVGDKPYADKAEALTAYATALDGYLASITAVRYAVGDKCVACPMEAQTLAKQNGGKVQYKLAAYTFEDKSKAEQGAKVAREAIEKVQLQCVVDGKPVTCEQSAREACTKSGKSCEYVVGQTKTNCPVTAKVELARARIEAALLALEKFAGA